MTNDIENVSMTMSVDTSAAVSSLEELQSSLRKLSRITKSTEKTASSIRRLANALKIFGTSASNVNGSVNSIVTAFHRLNSDVDVSVFEKLNSAINKIKLTSFNQELSQMAVSMAMVKEGANSFQKIANSISKLGTLNYNDIFGGLVKSFKASGILELLPQITQLAHSMNSLALYTGKASKNIGKAAASARKATEATRKLDKSTKKANDTLAETRNVSEGFFRLLYIFRRFSSVLSKMIELSVSFTENINLFGVAMGETTVKQAVKFIDAMHEAFHLDTSALMKYMGVFQQLNIAMGMTADQAYVISENFTKLGLDIASLYNITVESAYSKLQSGLAGLPRPLREIGIDITENALSLTASEEAAKAYARGDKELGDQLSLSIEKWSRVQKQLIIYLTILRQTTNAQGDFAKTFSTPANQLKVLYEQLDTLGRNIGNLVYASLSDILPLINAIVHVLNDFVSDLAELAGYEMPSAEKSAQNSTSAMNEYTDSVNEANKAVNGLIGGLDKFNTLSQPKIKQDNLSVLNRLELPDYSNQMDEIEDKAKKIYEALKPFTPLIGGLVTALTALIGLSLISKLAEIIKMFKLTSVTINPVIVSVLAFSGALLLLIKNWDKLKDNLHKVLMVIASGVITAATIMTVRYVSAMKKIQVETLKTVKTLKKFKYATLETKIGISSIGVSLLAVVELFSNFDNMTNIQKVIGVLGALTATCFAAAAAIGAFHSAWSVGLATAAIVAGIAAVTYSITQAKKEVSQYATGGFPEKGELFIANEKGPELVGSMGGKSNAVANNDMIVASIEEAAYRGISAALNEHSNGNNANIEISIDDRSLNANSLARVIAPALRAKMKNTGGIL